MGGVERGEARATARGRPDDGLSDEDCRRIALAVARLLESAWDREQAAREAARRGREAG